jgi:hypothetical protein
MEEESMLRRFALVSLAIVLVFAMVTMASAKQNVATTSTKGSLLVFPKILTFDNATTSEIIVDTYISIGNDSPTPVSVECYWMDNNQTIEDFQFKLTPNQPVFFSAFYGGGYETSLQVPPFRGVGSLVCFAVSDQGDTQIKYNHLHGNALIQVVGNPYWFYNAASFAAPNGVQGAPIGTPGQLALDGSVYDACPQYLLTNFFSAPDDDDNNTLSVVPWPFRADLTLWPCRQDLRQDRTPTCTKAKFDVWNANEVKFTGAYQCFKCFYEGFLDEIGRKTHASDFSDGDTTQRGPGFGWEKFTRDGLGTVGARMRVQGVASTVCDNKIRGCPAGAGVTKATPLLGIMMYAVDIGLINSNNAKTVIPYAGGPLLFGAGVTDGSALNPHGLVQWDPAGPTPEAPRQ